VDGTTGSEQRGGIGRRLRFWLVYLVYLFLFVEFAAHAYWGIVRKTSILCPNIWSAYFREWDTSGVAEANEENRDRTCRVLLLGGSVVSEEYGSVGPELADGLAARIGRRVRVYNLAFPARTSRDSLLKYRALAQKHFDLVVYYHGINDTHMNCCPPELYRDDYRHCLWYDEIHTYQKLGNPRWLVSPFTIFLMGSSSADALQLRPSISRLYSDADWAKYGGDVKTRKAFRDNLTELIEHAHARRETVLAMTFAYHLPHVIAGSAGDENPADYASGESLVKIWGRGEFVARGIDVHNAIVRDIVREDSNVLFIDQHALMPRGPEHFADCCHLTQKGCTALVRNIVDGVADKLDSSTCLSR
jgi:hypothetical protein